MQKIKGAVAQLEEHQAGSLRVAGSKPVSSINDYFKEKDKKVRQLLRNIKKHMPLLKKLLKKVSGHWNQEDAIYRFYHSSMKVYYVQGLTVEIVSTLKILAPKDVVFNEYFQDLYIQGTGKNFSYRHNRNWMAHTRPMIECFFHAKYFLEMAIKYGSQLEKIPKELPNGWALLLYFYGLR